MPDRDDNLDPDLARLRAELLEALPGEPCSYDGDHDIVATVRSLVGMVGDVVVAAQAIGSRPEPPTPGGPDDGHTAHISVWLRGSSTVTGDAHHRDAAEFPTQPWQVRVRGWSLAAALRAAAEVSLGDWVPPYGDDHGDDETPHPPLVAVPREALLEYVDDEPCDRDHHGGCQAHGHLGITADQKCPQVALRGALAATWNGVKP